LDEFLLPSISNQIRQATLKADEEDGLGFINNDKRKPNVEPPSPISYAAGVGGGWCAAGPVHKQRFLYLKDKQSQADGGGSSSSNPLCYIQKELIESEPFIRWLNEVTCFKILQQRCLTRRFRPGLDYTVAHVGTLTSNGKPCLDATLCFVNDGEEEEEVVEEEEDQKKKTKSNKKSKQQQKKKKQEKSELWHLWDGGEVGGFECYVEVEEGGENAGGGGGEEGAPEVYDSRSALEYGEGKSSKSSSSSRRNGGGGGGGEEEEEEEFDSEDEEEAGGTLLSVQARFNTLSLVTRDEGVMRFVKYVSAFAPGSRWDVASEFQVE
jgi:prolyl 3-hydroxylase /prolyl 3,4-dihydroxylase